MLPVDPALLTVTGFDPATQRFQYIPGVGATAARQVRTLFQPPLTVSLDVRLDVGRNLETQRIETFIKRGDAGAPLPPSQFRQLKGDEITKLRSAVGLHQARKAGERTTAERKARERKT